MIHNGAELHNIAELLPGDLHAVLGPEARAAIAEPGVLPWETRPGAATAGLWLSRVPDELRRRLHFRGEIAALAATGAEIRFNLRGRRAQVTLQAVQRPAVVEVWQGTFVVDWHVVQMEPTTITVSLPEHQPMLEQAARERAAVGRPLPFAPALTRVILPWRPAVKLLGLEGDLEPPRADQTPARRYLAYGSSITHGNLSVQPTATYAQHCARRLGVDLLNMGFGGAAKLEPELARWLASRSDWDFATLELGINLVSFIEAGEFERLVRAFVSTIAARRPEKPLFCIDLFPCRNERQDPAKVARFRAIVREAVEALGSPAVVHVEGPSLLDGFAGLSADMLHPSPLGMEQIGERLAARIAGRLVRADRPEPAAPRRERRRPR